jgi:hypothetical protein
VGTHAIYRPEAPSGYDPRVRRFYFFEIFVVLNLAAIALLAHDTLFIAGSPLLHIALLTITFAGQILVGIAVRSLVALVRRDHRRYFRAIGNRRWIADTVRIALGAGVMSTTYLWIKLVVPLRHPRLFDQELWDLDQVLFFGLAPALFFLDLFEGPMIRFIDLAYAKVFYVSGLLAIGYFASHPSRRLRVAFVNGNVALWITGAWLYMLVPSLGPAFRFPQIWLEYAASLRDTQVLQALLMRNYQNVLRAAAGEEVTAPIRIVFGIGAFPSLHVAFQLYVFFWMRRIWTSGEVLFALFFVTILLGSMITGWHYLVDGLAGIVIAVLCYLIFWKRARLGRWLRLRHRLARAS